MNYADRLLKFRQTHFKKDRYGKTHSLSQKDMWDKIIGCSSTIYDHWEHGSNIGPYFLPKVKKVLQLTQKDVDNILLS